MPAAERRLSSDGHKGGRKVVVAKRPGPAPAEPLKKRSKTDRKKAEVDRMRNKRERKLEDKHTNDEPKLAGAQTPVRARVPTSPNCHLPCIQTEAERAV